MQLNWINLQHWNDLYQNDFALKQLVTLSILRIKLTEEQVIVSSQYIQWWKWHKKYMKWIIFWTADIDMKVNVMFTVMTAGFCFHFCIFLCLQEKWRSYNIVISLQVYAWEIADHLLRLNVSVETSYFAAQTMRTKVISKYFISKYYCRCINCRYLFSDIEPKLVLIIVTFLKVGWVWSSGWT